MGGYVGPGSGAIPHYSHGRLIQPRCVARRWTCLEIGSHGVRVGWRSNVEQAGSDGRPPRLGHRIHRSGNVPGRVRVAELRTVLDGRGRGGYAGQAPGGPVAIRVKRSPQGRRGSKATEEDRRPVGRTDFKSDGTRETCPVGSTPTLFRHGSRPGRYARSGRTPRRLEPGRAAGHREGPGGSGATEPALAPRPFLATDAGIHASCGMARTQPPAPRRPWPPTSCWSGAGTATWRCSSASGCGRSPGCGSPWYRVTC